MATAAPIATPAGHGLGYRQAVDRPQIAPLSALIPATVPLPVFTRNRDRLGRSHFNQGSLPICTGCGTALQLEDALVKEGVPVPVHRSPQFNYYWGGVLEGDVQAAGRDPRYVVQAMARYGDCPEHDWSIDPANFNVPPSSKAVQAAQRRKVVRSYEVPISVVAIKAALASGYLVGVGLQVYPSVEQPGPDNVIYRPQPGEPFLGGHYPVLVDYADVAVDGIPAGTFLLWNSWGDGWCAGGNAFLAQDYIEGTAGGGPLVYEALVISAATR